MLGQTQTKVIQLIADVLGLEDSMEEITMDSNLVDDLAAESIDFIDLCFRLEKDFNLGKISPDDIFPTYLRDDDAYDENNKLKEKKLFDLNNFPHVRDDLLDELKKTRDFRTLLKVKNLVYFADWKLSNG